MTYESLLLTKKDGVATIVLNRDDIRNALAPEVRRELMSCLELLRKSPRVRVVVLTGAGNAFSAGGSIKRFKEQAKLTPTEVRDEVEETVDLFKLITRLDKPIIAAVNGYALGGGCGLAIACDITLASDRAQFGFPEITRGFVPAIVSVLCLQRLGLKKSLELLMLGEVIKSPAAVEAGLASRVVPHDELMSTAYAMALRIASFSPEATRSLRQLIFAIASTNFDASLFSARDVSTLMRFSTDFAAGATDFLSRGSGKLI